LGSVNLTVQLISKFSSNMFISMDREEINTEVLTVVGVNQSLKGIQKKKTEVYGTY